MLYEGHSVFGRVIRILWDMSTETGVYEWHAAQVADGSRDEAGLDAALLAMVRA